MDWEYESILNTTDYVWGFSIGISILYTAPHLNDHYDEKVELHLRSVAYNLYNFLQINKDITLPRQDSILEPIKGMLSAYRIKK